jgi:tetratricopeptide (TPR) repeat protein
MFAPLFLASALALAGVPADHDIKPSAAQIADQKRLAACVAKIDQDAEAAYEEAMAWDNETRAPEARRCAALAMIGRGEPDVGAQRLEALAVEKNTTDMATRAEILVEAGNAWIVAEEAGRALADFDAALKIAPGAPDVLIDRARARIMLGDWRNAEEDLSAALDKRPKDWYALTMRAQARLKQNALDLALRDAEAALKIEPKNDAALEVRGEIIDARSKAGAVPQ